MPLGSAQMHSMWSRGSNLKNTSTTNAFSVLENIDTEKKISGGSGNNGANNNSRSGRREAYSSKGPSMERSSYSSYDGRGSRGGSRAGSRSGSQQRSNESSSQSLSATPTPKLPQVQQQPAQPVTTAASAIANLTEVQLQRRITNALQEYLGGSAKYGELEQEIRTEIPQSLHTKYVYEW